MTLQKSKNKHRRRKTTALLLILSFLIAVIPAIPFAAEKADTDEITIVREETDRRTANEKHFLCSDGSMMAVSYSGDVHYMDETGKYLTASSDALLEMTDASTPKSLWEFRPAGTGTFRIVSRYQSGKCLHVTYDASADSYTVGLQNISTGLNNAQTFYVQSVNGQYKITNELYGTVLYVAEDASGNAVLQNAPDTDVPDGADSWQMLDAPAYISESITATVYNSETAHFLTAMSSSSVDMTAVATTESMWQFTVTETGGCRIVSQKYPEYCLTASTSGAVTLAAIATNNDSQLWYVGVIDGEYSIVNVQYKNYFRAVKDSEGDISCISGTVSASEEREFMISTTIPDAVVKISSATNASLYLKNETGKNYNDQNIITGSYEYNPYYDKCGFRVVYNTTYSAYMLMPISSSNGHYRAVTAADTETMGASNLTSLQSVSSATRPRQLFDIELQSDGTYALHLKNTALYLTAYANGYCGRMNEAVTNLTNQKWSIGVYEYTLPSGTKEPYAKVENYYSSLGFGSPFGTSAHPITVTSDFGPRNISSYPHKAVDLRTKLASDGSDYYRNLYSPYSGIVVDLDNDDERLEETEGTGKYVVIDTGIVAYKDSNYTICIVYMHMNEVDVVVDQKVTTETILGQSGIPGTTEAHLHYVVFLKPINSTNYPDLWKNNPINPMWFLEPVAYAI